MAGQEENTPCIVKKLRSAFIVQFPDGSEKKYVEQKKKTPKKKKIPQSVAKKNTQTKTKKLAQKKNSKSECEAKAAQLPTCRVNVLKMTDEEAAEIIRKGRRATLIQKLNDGIRKLPRRSFVKQFIQFKSTQNQSCV